MHTRIHEEFERICSKRNITGSVLEVGALPNNRSLLYTKPGGLVIIGVPGYRQSRIDKFQKRLEKLPGLRKLGNNRFFNLLFTGTLTFKMHSAPGDYYRFSPQAMKKVFFEGMDKVHVRSLMQPPRLIGIGTKKAA